MGKDDFEFSPPSDLICSDEERDLIEAKNSIRLFDKVVDLFEHSNGVLSVTPDSIAELQRIAMQGILGSAGTWRTRFVDIQNSNHVPPKHSSVAPLVQEMCEYATDLQISIHCLHVAGFLLWRLNWIHPFPDGNGRVSRALCCWAYCVGFEISPYETSIFELIDNDKNSYFESLRKTDSLVGISEDGIPDMRHMEDFMIGLHLKSME